mgnify:CR=1 FL=1
MQEITEITEMLGQVVAVLVAGDQVIREMLELLVIREMLDQAQPVEDQVIREVMAIPELLELMARRELMVIAPDPPHLVT